MPSDPRPRFTRPGLITVAAAAVLLATAPVHGQRLSGLVVESEVLIPIDGADVVLLDAVLNEVLRTRTGPDGRFTITAPGPGAWVLQAEAGGRFSSLLAAPEPSSAAADSLLLIVPSVLVDLAGTCPAAGADPVLAGIVEDAESGVPVPSVRVSATWPGQERAVVSTTDRSGRYRVCAVPAGADVTVRVEGLGREALSTFRVPDADFVRADLALELGTGSSRLRVVEVIPSADSTSAEVGGRLHSTEAAEPVTGIAVRAAGSQQAVLTAEDGRFRLSGLPAGDVVLEIEHLAFGTHREVVTLVRGRRTEVEITLVPRPIALRPIEVMGSAAARLAARSTPHRFAVLAGRRLAEAELRGARVSDVIREFPGILVMEGTFTTKRGLVNGVCVTSTRAVASFTAGGAGSSRFPWCEPLLLVVNGAPVADPVDYLRSLGVQDYESVQVLGALEAQIHFGMSGGAAGGAILLWTRGSGPFTSADRNR